MGPPALVASPAPARPAAAGPAATADGHAAAWSRETRIAFGARVVFLPVVVFALLRLAPFLDAPLGRAIRGESVLASGALAVSSLIAAAILVGIVMAGRRSRDLLVAAASAVVLGLVMIIVTFGASEAVELGTTPAAASLVPFIGPLVPLGVGLASLKRARQLWLSPYEQRDARLFAGLTAFMLLLVAELSPLGAVRSELAPDSHTASPR